MHLGSEKQLYEAMLFLVFACQWNYYKKTFKSTEKSNDEKFIRRFITAVLQQFHFCTGQYDH
jgi:hypothetical protein